MTSFGIRLSYQYLLENVNIMQIMCNIWNCIWTVFYYNEHVMKKESWGYDMSKKALITGITGQDGSYLAELLLEKGKSRQE